MSQTEQNAMPTTGRHHGHAFGLALASLLFASTCTAGTVGQDRCLMLDGQLSGIRQAADIPAPKAVSALADKARTLCAAGKTAQGLRAYAKALGLMGRRPVFPAEQQANQSNERIKS